ncbi:hypothetical protein A0H81_06031 [Grifola frondosa]|uniref:C2H2-type domain-containing protein n=1 Tax=Grifola frondosa TaxID=5627 RepID=A0A1C7MGH8_GRIFR|nr:hypothetical protein A0H81_06031 [Grifola frondosa]
MSSLTLRDEHLSNWPASDTSTLLGTEEREELGHFDRSFSHLSGPIMSPLWIDRGQATATDELFSGVQTREPMAGSSSFPDAITSSLTSPCHGGVAPRSPPLPYHRSLSPIEDTSTPNAGSKRRWPCPCALDCRCEKTFARSKDASRHAMSRHLGIRGFCHLCQKELSRRDYRHLQSCKAVEQLLAGENLLSLPKGHPEKVARLKELQEHIGEVEVKKSVYAVPLTTRLRRRG